MSGRLRRLFFALWPDERLRAELLAWRQRLGQPGRLVPDHNLHLTLAFLGNQPEEGLADLLTQADSIQAAQTIQAAAPPALVLDRFGWFPHAQVLWLGGQANPALQDFQQRLSQAMTALGIRLDARPWRPHITLFRKVADRPVLPAAEARHWPPQEFVLVESLPGRPYEILQRWPLLQA